MLRMISEAVLTIYADKDGEIEPYRVRELLDQAERLGGDTAPLEYVPPIVGGDPVPWGLRIRMFDEGTDPDD